MENKRAIRRHHRSRLKRNRRKYNNVSFWGIQQDELDIRAAKAVDTPCSCSCYMCGNPRHHWLQRTRKEKLWDVIEKEGKDEVFGLHNEADLIE